MRRHYGITIALLLLMTTAASRSHDSARLASGSAPTAPPQYGQAEPVLSQAIEAQIVTVATLAHRASPARLPDPRLFGALARLEEMLPRSAATRRLQEQGKKAYVAAVSGRSLKLAKAWPAFRARIEREIRRDRLYMSALKALDRRFAVSSATAPLSSIASRAATAGPVRRSASLPFDQMCPGDIMIWDDRSGPPLVRVALSLFAMECTHSAIYLGETNSRGSDTERWTLEAQSPALGVRSALMGRKWMRKGLHVALGHVRGFTPARSSQIAGQAVQEFGVDGRTPYHIWPPWDKTYIREGLYCSQLVWCVYQRNGVDLDSNDWRYLTWFTVHNWFNPYAATTAYFGVFPDEIKRSPNVTWYYDQVNP